MEQEYAKQKILEWYQLHSNEIYRFILIMIGDDEQAKDLMHDTFLKSYQSMHQYEGKTSVKNWLYRIARNITIDYKRKTNPIKYVVGSVAIFSSEDHCPEKISELGEMEAQLYQALNKLKHSYQEVIILRKIKDLSIKETAEVLHCTENKVKITLFRALQALKKQLEKEGFVYEEI